MKNMQAEFSLTESAELLVLAEQIGRVGVIDWQVPDGVVRMSANALAIGLTAFDGRYDSWIRGGPSGRPDAAARHHRRRDC